MRSKIVERLLRETPLDIKLKVSNQMYSITLITELGYRENRMWNEDDPKDMEILRKLSELSNKHTQDIIKEIKDHEKEQYIKNVPLPTITYNL